MRSLPERGAVNLGSLLGLIQDLISGLLDKEDLPVRAVAEREARVRVGDHAGGKSNACPVGRRHASAATQSVPRVVGTLPWATMDRRVCKCDYTQDRRSQLRGGRVNSGATRSYGLV
jgi:hypothetical protein